MFRVHQPVEALDPQRQAGGAVRVLEAAIHFVYPFANHVARRAQAAAFAGSRMIGDGGDHLLHAGQLVRRVHAVVSTHQLNAGVKLFQCVAENGFLSHGMRIADHRRDAGIPSGFRQVREPAYLLQYALALERIAQGNQVSRSAGVHQRAQLGENYPVRRQVERFRFQQAEHCRRPVVLSVVHQAAENGLLKVDVVRRGRQVIDHRHGPLSRRHSSAR